jgi:hypothetical protein
MATDIKSAKIPCFIPPYQELMATGAKNIIKILGDNKLCSNRGNKNAALTDTNTTA